VHKIREHVDKTRQIQNILRAIETRDRSISEANFERVNFWSGVQVFVMVSVAITHVLMIRSLFEDRGAGKSKIKT
jgi:protein ERP2